jgi:hypothetical protein
MRRRTLLTAALVASFVVAGAVHAFAGVRDPVPAAASRHTTFATGSLASVISMLYADPSSHPTKWRVILRPP